MVVLNKIYMRTGDERLRLAPASGASSHAHA